MKKERGSMEKSKLSYNELIELQKCYRVGSIKEEDIPAEDMVALENLYNEQIAALEKSIEDDRLKIMEIRSKYTNI